MFKQIIPLFLFCAALFFPSFATAHPHAFTEAKVSFVVEDGQLKGIKEVWLFDDMFSMFMMEEFDDDRDGMLSEKEHARVERESFGTLFDSGYFTHINVNEEFISTPKGTHFQATMQGSRMQYSFFIPLTTPAPSRVVISLFDESYYADMAMEVDDDEGLNVTLSEAPEYAYYSGMIVPVKATLTIR
ncbi:MAG: DUF1007 family protein [Desulfovibrio sp.]